MWENSAFKVAAKLETEKNSKDCDGNDSEKSNSRCFVDEQSSSCENYESIFNGIGNNPNLDVELQTFSSIVRQPQTVNSECKFEMKTSLTFKEQNKVEIYTYRNTLGSGNQSLDTKSMDHQTCSRLQNAGERQNIYHIERILNGRVDAEIKTTSQTRGLSTLKVCDNKAKHSIEKYKIGTALHDGQKDPVEEKLTGPSQEIGLPSYARKLAVVETEHQQLNYCVQDVRCCEVCNEGSFENITLCCTDHLNTRRCPTENLEANSNNGEEMRKDAIFSVGSRGHYVTHRQGRRDLFEIKNTSKNADVNYGEELVVLSSGNKDCEGLIKKENRNSKQQSLEYSENHHDARRRSRYERNHETNTQCSEKSIQNPNDTAKTRDQNNKCDDEGHHNKTYSIREITSKRSESANSDKSSFSGNERNSKNRDVMQLTPSTSEDRRITENWRNCDEKRFSNAKNRHNRWNFHLRWNRQIVKRKITSSAYNKIFEPSGRFESKETILERRINKRHEENPNERHSTGEERKCCGNRKPRMDEHAEYGESKHNEHNLCGKRRSHSDDRFHKNEDKEIEKDIFARAPRDECHSGNSGRSDITCSQFRHLSRVERFYRRAKSPSEELGGNEIITGTNNSLTEHSQYQFYVQERKVESQTAISKDKRSQIENPSKEDSKQDSSTKHFGREKKVEDFNNSKDRYGNERSRSRSKSRDRYVRFGNSERDERRTAKQWASTRSDCGRQRLGYRRHLANGLNKEEENKRGQESRREVDERSKEGERKRKIRYTKEDNSHKNERLSPVDLNADTCTYHYEDPQALSTKIDDAVMTDAGIQYNQETEKPLAKGTDNTDQSLTTSYTARNEENRHWGSVSTHEIGQTSVDDTKNMTGMTTKTNESNKSTFVERRRANLILQISSNIVQEDASLCIPSAGETSLTHTNENLPSRNEDILQSCPNITKKHEAQQKQIDVDDILSSNRVCLAGEVNPCKTLNHNLRLTTKENATRRGKETSEESHCVNSKRKRTATEQLSKDIAKTDRPEHCHKTSTSSHGSCDIRPTTRNCSETDRHSKRSRSCFSKRRNVESEHRANDYDCSRRNRRVFVYKKHGRRIFTRWEPFCLVSPKSRSDYDEDTKLKWPEDTNSNDADNKEEIAERRKKETIRKENSKRTIKRQSNSEDNRRDHKTTSKGKQ